MKFKACLFMVLFITVNRAEETEEPVSSSDVALLRNVLSSAQRTNGHLVLSPSYLSLNRLRETARWLNKNQLYWQHLPHNDILSLFNWHTGHHQLLHRPFMRPTARPPTYLGVKPQLLASKPTAKTFVKPPWMKLVKPTVKTDVEIKPLSFSSWHSLWNEEDVGKCGLPEVETNLKTSRIFGGNVAKPGAWPWMVSLLLKPMGQHFCAGVLISAQWVLTAPHCFQMWNSSKHPQFQEPQFWTVRLGKFNTSVGLFEENREEDFSISRLIIHPEFKTHPVYQEQLKKHLNVPMNDIALIKLERPATFSKWVKPLCLPYNDEVPRTGRMCVISGWGVTEESGYPGVLNEAALPVYSTRQCSRQFPGYDQLLTPNNICAGFQDGKVDACNNDSGGPLQCKFRNRWVISGLVSYGDAGGDKCAQPMRPGVYTRTDTFVEWIHQQIYRDYTHSFNKK